MTPKRAAGYLPPNRRPRLAVLPTGAVLTGTRPVGATLVGHDSATWIPGDRPRPHHPGRLCRRALPPLPIGNEPDIIAGAVPPGASILELGSGAGRMTHPLIACGFELTCVDESPEMLAQVRGARTVRSSIETLDLGEKFDVVLLASFLVHAAEPDRRQALLETCRRHVRDDGCVLIQREAQDQHDNLPRTRPSGNGVVRVLSSEPVSPGVRSVHVENVYPDARWTQTFLSRPLTVEEFESALMRVGLTLDTYLTDDRVWAMAIGRQ